jgi:uncharacterized protein YjiS (DUF1127 family)
MAPEVGKTNILTELSFSIGPVTRGVARGAATLARGTWQIVVARRTLARLADRDDRMLADIRLTRGDLRDAGSAPLWQNPTRILEQRVSRRRAD